MYTVELSDWVALAPSSTFERELYDQARGNPSLPGGSGQIRHDLATRHDSVPVILREPTPQRKNWQVGLYLRSYVVWMYETNRNDGYLMTKVSPVRLTDHDRLARGC